MNARMDSIIIHKLAQASRAAEINADYATIAAMDRHEATCAAIWNADFAASHAPGRTAQLVEAFAGCDDYGDDRERSEAPFTIEEPYTRSAVIHTVAKFVTAIGGAALVALLAWCGGGQVAVTHHTGLVAPISTIVAAPIINAVVPPLTPSVVVAKPAKCGNVNLGGIVGITYLCPSAGPITLASDGCDGGARYAQAEVTAVARYTGQQTSMVCGSVTYSGAA